MIAGREGGRAGAWEGAHPWGRELVLRACRSVSAVGGTGRLSLGGAEEALRLRKAGEVPAGRPTRGGRGFVNVNGTACFPCLADKAGVPG